MEDGNKIIAEVFEAMDKGEIVPFFQPKVDIRDNTIIGAEALVRWKQGDRFVAPFAFLPPLEESGDICKLDMYIFERVCEYLKQWEEEDIKIPTISSNFSMKHLRNENFVADLEAIADKHDVDRAHLEIELTETDSPDEMKRLVDVVFELRKAGFRTSLDDFGSGYSSLSLVKDVNVDVIKLDKSLLSSWDDVTNLSQKDRALMKHVVGLIKDMSMMCLTEGVETVQQKEFLRSINCNYVQGYLYDKPLPEPEFRKRLLEGPYDTPEEDASAPAETAKSGVSEEHEDSLEGLKILLAEDNDINREVAKMMLEGMGAKVIEATDGADAFNKFRRSYENEINAILMDIQMPVMDGYDSTVAIRGLDRADAKTVPIIAITVDAYRETRDDAEAVGMSGYVTKPLDPHRLLAVIKGGVKAVDNP